VVATKEKPFVNSLRMNFVPVPITGGPTDGRTVLFSVWETRVKDYEVFVKETKREWPKPDFPQSGEHPAVNLTWDDAVAFCAWLTIEDRKSGKIGPNDVYRLPSDHEWSCAVGIGKDENPAASPSGQVRENRGISLGQGFSSSEGGRQSPGRGDQTEPVDGRNSNFWLRRRLRTDRTGGDLCSERGRTLQPGGQCPGMVR